MECTYPCMHSHAHAAMFRDCGVSFNPVSTPGNKIRGDNYDALLKTHNVRAYLLSKILPSWCRVQVGLARGLVRTLCHKQCTGDCNMGSPIQGSL